MKRSFLKEVQWKHARLWGMISLVLFCFCGFTACSDEDDGDGPAPGAIWDFYPILLRIEIQDAEGNDLLNPEVSGNICEQKIIAIHKDKTYEKDSLQNLKKSRAYLACLYGLYNAGPDKEGKHCLEFGQFAGEKTYTDEEVTIVWEDGTKDVITFSSELKWKKHEPVITREFKLNGVDNGERKNNFLFIREPAK